MAEKDLIEAAYDVMIEWAQEMSDEMRASLLRHDHVDSAGPGNLYQAATALPEKLITENGEYALAFRLVLPDYYYFLNKGRGKTKAGGGKPGKLQESLFGASGWIARKGINVRQATGLKDSVKANKTMAFLISRKIHEKGFKASHWFDEVWGSDPVADNSPAIIDLQNRLAKVFGNEKFIIQLIDPNQPD